MKEPVPTTDGSSLDGPGVKRPAEGAESGASRVGPGTGPAPLTGASFLDAVRRSELLTEKQLADYLARRQSAGGLPDDARRLAAEMVRDGLLTRFQATQLLASKTRGFIINGKYRILEHLGSGGMGQVYLCSHVSMHRRVAVKVLPVDKAKDDSYLERFYREARAVAALDHPNIVRAHDVDRDSRFHFLVMEYIEGSSLQEIVNKSGPLEPVRAAHYIAQAALGLQHAHEVAGLVHRDIKPGNVMVDRNGTVKVLDLGLARFFNDDDGLSKKHDDALIGTTDYLAPEQTLETAVDIRADIYSLGATFYFCLTGKTLFGEGRAAQKLIWHQTRQPKPICSLRPEVPAEMAELIEKRMLAKNPAERFQQPIEVFEALQPWLATPIDLPPDDEMPRLCPAAQGGLSDGPGSGHSVPLSPAPGRSEAGRRVWSASGLSRPASSGTSARTRGAPTTTLAAGDTASGSQPRGKPDSMDEAGDSGPQRPLGAATQRRWLLVGAACAVLLAGAGAAAALWGLPGLGSPPSRSVAAPPAAPISLAPPPVPAAQTVPPAPAPPAVPAVPAVPAAPEAVAGVSFRPDGGGFQVRAAAYEATVAADGCLTSLRVGDREFFWVGGKISRGAYLFQDNGIQTLKLPTIERRGGVISASSDLGSLRYEFRSDGLNVTAKNATAGPLHFFMVFNAGVLAVRDESGDWAKTPLGREWHNTTWFAGPARLTLTGSDRLWGPWENNTQVFDAVVGPGQERKVTIRASTTTPAEAARVAALAGVKPAVASDVPMLSPVDYQVFQRQSPDRGTVLVRGRLRKDKGADAVQVRLTGMSKGGPLPGDWRPAALRPDRSFSTELPAPAGGWYRLEVQALRGKDVVAREAVDHVGVGEVFIMAGQSNSTNCGQQKLQQHSGMVASFGGTDWRLANDPQPGVHDKSTGGSPWPAFGDAMYAKYRVPIGIASTGHAGTAVKEWQPGGELFRWLTGRMAELGPHGFRAVLWHQGESDVGTAPDDYVRMMTELIRGSQKAAGWKVPWFVALASYQNPYNRTFATVRGAQKKLWDTGVALEGPDTDTLAGDNRDNGGQGIHFSAKGNTAHGKMWAEKVGAWLDKVLERPGK